MFIKQDFTDSSFNACIHSKNNMLFLLLKWTARPL